MLLVLPRELRSVEWEAERWPKTSTGLVVTYGK